MAVAADNRVGQVKPARGLMEVLDFATRSHGRAVVVLVVVALLSILPGFFAIPPTDRDESRFAQATKQMIESGDYIDIRFQETTRYKKPVGIYWLQASVVKTAQALGHARCDHHHLALSHSLAARRDRSGAADLLGGAGVPVAARSGVGRPDDGHVHPAQRRGTDRQDRRHACCSPRSRSMGAMARAYLPEQRSQLEGTSAWTVPAIFWTALAASVLLKGPVIPLIVFLTVVTLVVVDRSVAWSSRFVRSSAMAWAALLVLPWFVAIIHARRRRLLRRSRSARICCSKLFQGQESHGAPPGYYLLLFWMTFWPAATLAGMAAPAVLGVATRARRANSCSPGSCRPGFCSSSW